MTQLSNYNDEMVRSNLLLRQMSSFFAERSAAERRAVRACFVGVLAAFLTLCFPANGQQSDRAPLTPEPLHSMNLAWMDSQVNPCADFYKYACGGWVKQHPVPADQERVAVFTQMNDRDYYLLYQQLQQAATMPRTPLQKQYGAFYSACMNVQEADARGVQPLQPTLAAIDRLTGKTQIGGLLGDANLMGAGFFSVAVTQDDKDSSKQNLTLRQDGLTLPTPDYYLETSTPHAATLLAFRHYLETIFLQLGDQPRQAVTEAQNVLEVENALARASMSSIDLRDPAKIYHPMKLTELERITPGIAWQAYFHAVGAPPFTVVDVQQPEYIEVMAKVIADEPLSALRSYLRLHAVGPMAPYLSQPFEQASFQLFNKTLRGQAEEQPRWKRCTQLTNHSLRDVVGQDWVKRNFSPQSKADAERLIAHLRLALREELEQLDWLSPEAKREALLKADSIREKIGYPEHWKDYSHVQIASSNFVSDLHQAQLFDLRDRLNRVGKPVDERRFYWTAPEADGNYDPSLNDIEFPAGILQSPFYSRAIDDAVNYGAMGTLIGHELTHGFDDEGSLYDEVGNRRNWFTPQDRAAFDKMSLCLIAEYNRFEAVPGLKLDGQLSLGENTADNGGLRIAYKAFQRAQLPRTGGQRASRIDGFTEDQRFFLGFAQSWCETRTEAYQRVRGQTDPHPPGEFRVNGAVQNLEQFGTAFGCHVGEPMLPEHSCHVW